MPFPKPRLPVVFFVGIGLALAAPLAELRGGSPGFGLVQWAMIFVGLGVLTLGWLGSGFGQVYQGVAATLLSVILLLVAAEVAATVLGNRGAAAPTETAVVQASYYRDQDWSATFRRETDESRQRVHYQSYVLWQRDAYQGETVRIDSTGARVTPGAKCEPGAFTVLTFGGSTMWGVGAPDWGTIPAFLQQGLAGRFPGSVCVRNLGEVGFVSTQEVVKLLTVLDHGTVPDLVIFYDGINDVIAAHDSGQPGAHYGLSDVRSRMEVSAGQQLLGKSRLVQWLGSVKGPPAREIAPGSTLADQTVAVYLENRRIVAALAAEYGFAYEFFWQPVLLFGREPANEEERRFRDVVPASLLALYKQVYPAVELAARDTPHLHYLGDVLDAAAPPVYADFGHLVPPANEIVANAMLARIGQPESDGSGRPH